MNTNDFSDTAELVIQIPKPIDSLLIGCDIMFRPKIKMVTTNPDYNLTFDVVDDYTYIFSPKCNVTIGQNTGL